MKTTGVDDLILTAGTFCMPAEILKRHNLRHAAYPFDWLFCSPSSINSIIRDNFKEFLDRKHLKPMTDASGAPRCMHELYDGLNPQRPTFAHHDPTQDEDRAYFERCIARFREAVNAGATLFLIEEFGQIEPRFDDLCAALAVYPKCRLIAVRHEPGTQNVSLLHENGPHKLYLYRASAVIGGLNLADPEDETFLVDNVLRPSRM